MLMNPSKKSSSHPATYYRDQAKDAQAKAAAAMPDSDMRRSWLKITDLYEKLAEVAEQAERDDQVS